MPVSRDSPSLPDEREIRQRCGGNGLLALMLLLDADEELRAHFTLDPASVLADFGLGCPADLVGVRGVVCPAMPSMPGGHADSEIADAHWKGWLRGGVRQVDPYRLTVAPQSRFPPRSGLSEQEWATLVQRVRSVIADFLRDIER